jgi:uncharacterized protein (TIGR00159 family)
MVLLGWQHVVDFVVLASAFYLVLLWARKNRALRIAVAALSLHVAAVVASRFGVTATVWVLDGAALLLALVLFVLFQPEVRHTLVYIDRVLSFGHPDRRALTGVHRAISEAAFALAEKGLGALLVITGGAPISDEVAHGGVVLDAVVSRETLEAIFLKDSRLHDGAVVVESDRITRAGALLPLTRRTEIATYLGARHRAALGLAECGDVSVLVVSEERGEVSLVYGREIRRIESLDELLRMLEESHGRPSAETRIGLRELVLSHLTLKISAAALAGLLLAVSFLENQQP